MNEVEKTLGIIKNKDESWQDIYNRLDKSGRIDFKVVAKILFILLDKIYGKE